jgi:hypothetical protein
MKTREERNAVLAQVLTANIDDVEAAELSAYRDHVGGFEATRVERDQGVAGRLAVGGGGDDGAGAAGGKGGAAAASKSLLPPSRLGAAVASLGGGAGGAGGAGGQGAGVTRRALGGMAALSGAEGIRYLEYTADQGGAERLRAADEAQQAERMAAAKAAAAAAGGGGGGGPRLRLIAKPKPDGEDGALAARLDRL